MSIRLYNVYLFRLNMYGDPVASVIAPSIKVACSLVRQALGPGTYDATRVEIPEAPLRALSEVSRR